MALRKMCVSPGCCDLAIDGGPHCPDHHEKRLARLAIARAAAKTSAAAVAGSVLYNDRRWRKAARQFLAHHPLCVDCSGVGLVVAAREVDHIVPHKGDKALFWQRSNWQPLCKPCHSRKTAREVFAKKMDRG